MNYLKTLTELYRMKKQTRLSPENMKKLQDGKVRKLLHYAWDHSAYGIQIWRTRWEALSVQSMRTAISTDGMVRR